MHHNILLLTLIAKINLLIEKMLHFKPVDIHIKSHLCTFFHLQHNQKSTQRERLKPFMLKAPEIIRFVPSLKSKPF